MESLKQWYKEILENDLMNEPKRYLNFKIGDIVKTKSTEWDYKKRIPAGTIFKIACFPTSVTYATGRLHYIYGRTEEFYIRTSVDNIEKVK